MLAIVVACLPKLCAIIERLKIVLVCLSKVFTKKIAVPDRFINAPICCASVAAVDFTDGSLLAFHTSDIIYLRLLRNTPELRCNTEAKTERITFNSIKA